MSTPAPDTIGSLSVAWIAKVATVLQREGFAFRAGRNAATIEIQNIHTGAFEQLTLEGRKFGDCVFASIADRDAVLAALAQPQDQDIRR
jgi:hypothetical protein